MPNVNAVLNEQIRRLAKREITTNTGVIRRATAEYRHVLAAMKKQLAALTKRVAVIEKVAPKEITAPAEVLEKARFRAMGVKAHRRDLGLSAKDYGKLVGVAGKTIYKWEGGQSRPQKAQMARWLAIRGLGKREALERLGMAETKTASVVAVNAPSVKPTRVVVFKTPAAKGSPQTGFQRAGRAQELIFSLLAGGKALLTSQIQAAWKKAKRPGRAVKTLGEMVQARKITRTAVPGERGSLYSLGKARVAVTPAKAPSAKPKRRVRATYTQTGEQLILALLKGRKTLTTGQINAAWTKAGRGWKADKVLGRMVAAGTLKRKRLGGNSGSEYRTR